MIVFHNLGCVSSWLTNNKFRDYSSMYMSRIRFFQLIWKKFVINRRINSLSRQKVMTSKVPTCDVREIMQISCVSGRVLMNFLHKNFLINYCENVFQKQTWHIKLGIKGKLYIYLGTNGFDEKVLKFGCKGLVQFQKEAQKSKRGYCCQGLKIPRSRITLNIFNIWEFTYFSIVDLIHIKRKLQNACIIHPT